MSEDRRARFEATALPFLRALHNTARHLTGRGDEAADLVQETFLRAYRAFDRFTPGTNCKAWLFTIMYSVFVNRWRKARREPAIALEEAEKRYRRLLADEAAPAAMEGLANSEVERALAALPEAYRAVVLLVDLEELTYEEAASALDCPVGTVRSRLFRARKLLFIALRDYARSAGFLKEPSAK